MTKTVNKTEFTIFIGFDIRNDESTFDGELTSKFSSESQNINDIMEDLLTFIGKTTDLPSKLKFDYGEEWVYSLHFESFFNDAKIEKFYESLCKELYNNCLFEMKCSNDILRHLNDEQISNMSSPWYWIGDKYYSKPYSSKKKKGSLSI
jgi:hypothetical protein